VRAIVREFAPMSPKCGLRQAFIKMAEDMSELLDTLTRHPSTLIVLDVGTLLLFIGETVGPAQEPPTGTIDPSDLASMGRSGLAGISAPVTAAQNGQATVSPGRWLIDDVARERAEFELRQLSPKLLSATNAAQDTAHVEAGVCIPSDDIRAGGDELRAEWITNSMGTSTSEGVGSARPHRSECSNDRMVRLLHLIHRAHLLIPRRSALRRPLVQHRTANTGITASIAKLTENAGTSEPSGRTQHNVAHSKAIDISLSPLRQPSSIRLGLGETGNDRLGYDIGSAKPHGNRTTV
jgi:hypothetical protein